ncbi:Pre-mRNA-splicing factor ATP-dependent RNA helicase PRP43 [Nosema granulosis]|uniref:Pre-mRNA-splicing factor ATP-dependent RNA helicase PRP43 n=1 Tax=Nosema granulosis TaxID=83296 RepID=A0A9P6GZ49_9MICR|nr:Pre-mRNA-splicing factor ATP-dependent RNA helicase PRP43 [Nosema granulosis]
MDNKKEIIDRIAEIANSNNVKLDEDCIDCVYDCIYKGEPEKIKDLGIDDIYNKLATYFDNYKEDTKLFIGLDDDSLQAHDIEKNIVLDSDAELNLKIPADLYIDKYGEKSHISSKTTSLINFLNNSEGCEDEETVEDKKDLIFSLLEENSVLLIQGNTGCGKTTKIPRMLLERYNNIVCTQPRRIAAISVAKKVAEDMKTEIGNLVGYGVRFDNATSDKTRLRFVTDGIILREILHDKELKKYDCIVVDEAHERSLNIDILLGYCKRLLKTRKDLKVIIMSATISTEKFFNFFDCPSVTIKHKVHPLKNYFIKSYNPMNYLEETVKTVIKLHKTEPVGIF